MSTTDSSRAHDAYLGQKYFSQLDGVRALSALLVITAHLYGSKQLWFWLGGGSGVILFFVLSGYLITTLALREETTRGRLSLSAFYVRRACRLLPLYYVTLGIYCVLFFGLGFQPHLRDALAEALPYYLVYLQEIPIRGVVMVGQGELPFSHSWTLGVEEKFYLLWAMLAFVLWRGTRRLRLGGTLTLAVGLAAAPTLLTPLGNEARLAGRMLFTYYPILVGCVLAQLLHDPRWFVGVTRWTGRGTAFAATALLLATHFTLPWMTPHSPQYYALRTFYPVAIAGFLCSILLHDGRVSRALRWSPLTFVGRISYGIYLIHILAMWAVYAVLPLPPLGFLGTVSAFLGTAALAITGAWVLSLLVEAPGIALGRYWSECLQAGREPVPKQVAPATA